MLDKKERIFLRSKAQTLPDLVFIGKEGLTENVLRQISQIEYSPVAVDEERFLLYMNDSNLVYITLTKIDKLNKYDKIKEWKICHKAKKIILKQYTTI